MTQEEFSKQRVLDTLIQHVREVCGEDKSDLWCMSFINLAVAEQLAWMSQEEE